MVLNNKREVRIATVSLAATVFFLTGLFYSLGHQAIGEWSQGQWRACVETAVFMLATFFLCYGNMLYHFCIIGHYKRRDAHTHPEREMLEAFYDAPAPVLTLLIPSYKEERSIIWQTLISSALSEYPEKNVVLLVDDPYRPKALEDMMKLEETRGIPVAMQRAFDIPAARFRAELEGYQARNSAGTAHDNIELNRLSMLYDDAAATLEAFAAEFMDGKPYEAHNHADRFFLDLVLFSPARLHRERAQELRDRMTDNSEAALHLERHYRRLAGLFNVRFSHFERKKYANLSHEANKAMNLNSYITLMGKSWKEAERNGELHLVETSPEYADFTIPAPAYVNTLDADSLMSFEYTLRLVHTMEKSGNERIAVAQSPCSSFPNCPNGLERIAGAGIDVQFLTHQGYTHWGASFWVGANAMLRFRALQEIRETRVENGHVISIFIQDRTVIEDTESTIDLLSKGWELYNYPERMTFSATPPDFGSLLIQRRRWANGGLIILPKLLRHAAQAKKNVDLLKEFFMRFNYLASTSIGCGVSALLFFYPFGRMMTNGWLPLSTLPFLCLYAHDLRNSGYKRSDLFRMMALNLMLTPITFGGVLKSVQQIFTGEKIPFGRTPKITGRTSAPAIYCLLEVLMFAGFAGAAGYYAMTGATSSAVFAGLNAVLMGYALVYFIGVGAAMQDMSAGIRERWRLAFHKAQILPISGGRKPAQGHGLNDAAPVLKVG